jgi:hypothetical protein
MVKFAGDYMSKISDFTSTFKGVLTLILPLLIVAISVFLLSGGVYEVREAIRGTPVEWREQLPTESLVSMILFGLSMSGLYLAFKSVRHLHTPREAYMLALVGLVLAALAYLGIYVLAQG